LEKCPPVRRSVAASATFVSSLLAVACGGATVAAGTSAILGRRPPIVGGGLSLGAGDLGLIRFQRVADRCVDVSPSGSAISRLSGTISRVGRSVGLVKVVVRGHGNEA